MLKEEPAGEKINLSPSPAFGSVTLLAMMMSSSTKSMGIINFEAFSIPLIPKKQIAVVATMKIRCQTTGSVPFAIKPLKSAGAWSVVA